MSAPHPDHREDYTPFVIIFVIVGLVAVVLVSVCAAGAVSGLLSGHGASWPHGTRGMLDAAKAVAHKPGDPAAGWPAPGNPGPAPLFWLCAVAIVVAAGYAAYRIAIRWMIHRHRDTYKERGLGGKDALETHELTMPAAVRRAHRTRAGLQHLSVNDLDPALTVARLGTDTASGLDVAVQQRDPIIVVSPTGGGKTWRVATQRVWDAPAGAVVTSTRADLPAATIGDRLRRGHVAVFDPEGKTGLPNSLRWSLLAGCEDEEVAMRRATALVNAVPMGNSENADYFQGRAATLLRCYLFAAARAEKGLGDVRLWAASRSNKYVRDILGEHNPSWEAELIQALDNEGRDVGPVISTLMRTLGALANPRLAAAMERPAADCDDVGAMLLDPAQANTMYLCSAATGSDTAAPIVATLAAELFHLAHEESQRRHDTGLMLDPPVRIIGDEFNNVAPIPAMNERITDSGGRGISLWLFVHNLLQCVQRWGPVGGPQLLKNAAGRLILPGISDEDELAGLEAVIGDRWARIPGVPNPVRTPIMSRAEIRQLHEGQGLLLYRNAPATLLNLPTVFDHPDTKAEVAASTALFRDIVTGTKTLATAGAYQ